MGYVIATSGKGGTGKTTFSALAVRYLKEKHGRQVLAVDADSNANLDMALGVKAEKTVGQLREHLTRNISNVPAGMSKDMWVEMMVQQALVEEEGFDLISMGRPEGPGCYCYLNNVFRRYLDILVNNYDFVVMDNEAGMEHLSRRTTRGVDIMFIMSDATLRGVETALRIRDLAREMQLELRKLALVVSRVRDGLPEAVRARAEEGNLPLAGTVPDDPLLRELDEEGKPLLELPEESAAWRAVRDIMDRWVDAGKAG
jgi:CO dehydrogenase maturation factor